MSVIRDKESRAIVSIDTMALDKYRRDKRTSRQLQDISEKLESLYQTVVLLREQVDGILEREQQ